MKTHRPRRTRADLARALEALDRDHGQLIVSALKCDADRHAMAIDFQKALDAATDENARLSRELEIVRREFDVCACHYAEALVAHRRDVGELADLLSRHTFDNKDRFVETRPRAISQTSRVK